jgi:vacuolar-type H+-ATPase subunit E/Vma4
LKEESQEARFIAALLARAEEDCRRIREEASQAAESILGKARSQTEDERRKRLEAAREKARREVGRKRAEERVRWAREELYLLDEAFRDSLEQARRRLGALREEEGYGILLRHLFEEARPWLPRGAPVTVLVDARDVEALEKGLEPEDRVETTIEKGGPFLGGLKLVSADESLVVDNTFEARLEARMPGIRARVGRIFLSR